MSALLSSELLKLRTTRTAFGFLVATVLLTLGVGAATFATIDVSNEQDLKDALARAGFVAALLLVLGIVASTGEYRHGTITSSLLVSPDRLRFLASKDHPGLLPHRSAPRPGGDGREPRGGRAVVVRRAMHPSSSSRPPTTSFSRSRGGAGRALCGRSAWRSGR